MAIRDANFYAPWPVLNKRLSFQWGNLRENHRETDPLLKNTFTDDPGTNEFREYAHAGQAQGSSSFRNRFRYIYLESDSKWRLQLNEGTVESPSWVDVLTADHPNKTVEVENDFIANRIEAGDGGIHTDGGFYGITHPEKLKRFAQFPTGKTFNSIEKLFVDNDDFYITPIKGGAHRGSPLLNLSHQFGRAQEFVQETPSTTWEINHGFGVSPVFVQVMDNGKEVILPHRADVSDPDTAFFYFSQAIAGSVHVATGGVGAAELVPKDPFYLVVRAKDDIDPHINRIHASLIFSDKFYVNTVEDKNQTYIDLVGDEANARKKVFSFTNANPWVCAHNLNTREVTWRMTDSTDASGSLSSSPEGDLALAGPTAGDEDNSVSFFFAGAQSGKIVIIG